MLEAKLGKVLLEVEQRELFVSMVEAARAVPKDRRDKFLLVQTFGGDSLIHEGFEGGELSSVYSGDLDTLVRNGLLAISYGRNGSPRYDVTPEGYAYYGYLTADINPTKDPTMTTEKYGQQVTLYRMFVASPNDCIEERAVIPEVIYQWNAWHSLAEAVILEPVKWETHSVPEMGGEGQSIIKKRLVEISDVMIAVFGHRLGTPTSNAESGTADEIREFEASGKPTMVDFSKAKVEYDTVDHAEYKRLMEFKKWCKSKGLLGEYADIEDLRQKLVGHVAITVQRLHKEAAQGNSETLAAQVQMEDSTPSSKDSNTTKQTVTEEARTDAEPRQEINIPTVLDPPLSERLDKLEQQANTLNSLLSHPGNITHTQYTETIDMLTNQMLPQVSELMNYPAFGQLIINFSQAAKNTLTERSRFDYFSKRSIMGEKKAISEFKRQYKILIESIRSLKGSET